MFASTFNPQRLTLGRPLLLRVAQTSVTPTFDRDRPLTRVGVALSRPYACRPPQWCHRRTLRRNVIQVRYPLLGWRKWYAARVGKVAESYPSQAGHTVLALSYGLLAGRNFEHSSNVVPALANVLVQLCELGSRCIQQLGGLFHAPQPRHRQEPSKSRST